MRKIVTPMEISQRIDATNTKKIVTLDNYNAFDPVLYQQLIIPSFIHGYSLAIEYVKHWFLDKFPENYFNPDGDREHVHLNGKHVYDDYKSIIKKMDKKLLIEKPFAVITPTLDYEYNREDLDLYQAGVNIYLKLSNFQQSFLKDIDKNIYLSMRMQQLKMNFNFRVVVSTKAEQIDLYKRMQLLFRIGATQNEYKSAYFVVPYDLMVNIASDLGFNIINDNGSYKIESPTELVHYLNKHSQLPFSFKLRAMSSNMEFFIRLDGLFCHIHTLDLSIDDGNRVGHLDTDFGVDMNIEYTMPVPHFFVYYNEKPLTYDIVVSDPQYFVRLYTIALYQIPIKNDKGWEKFIDTEYVIQNGENSIDISPLFKDTKIEKIAKYCISNEISCSKFLDIEIFKMHENIMSSLKKSIDYNNFNISLDYIEEKENDNLYISVYIDKEFVNDMYEICEKISGRIS